VAKSFSSRWKLPRGAPPTNASTCMPCPEVHDAIGIEMYRIDDHVGDARFVLGQCQRGDVVPAGVLGLVVGDHPVAGRGLGGNGSPQREQDDSRASFRSSSNLSDWYSHCFASSSPDSGKCRGSVPLPIISSSRTPDSWSSLAG
jgi:hypothetical protein